MTLTSPGSIPASSSAARITISCALPFGAAIPALRPSWLMADPRMTPSTLSPSAMASDSRFSTIIAQPSARTYPSAEASKVWHRPVKDIMRERDAVTDPSGKSIRLTPPASAMSDSCARRLCTARWMATREDEHAVSTAMFGPCTPRW